MLLTALAMFYCLALCWVAGALVEHRLLRIASSSLYETALVGLLAGCTALTAVALVVPLTPALHALLAVAVLVAGGWSWKCFREAAAAFRRPRAVPLLLAAVGVLWLASGPPQVYDTGFYHAQAVRWLNECGTVPGLANLHGRLGFNSVSFSWAAFWDHGLFDGRSYHLVNLAFWVLGFGLFLEAVDGWARGGGLADCV